MRLQRKSPGGKVKEETSETTTGHSEDKRLWGQETLCLKGRSIQKSLQWQLLGVISRKEPVLVSIRITLCINCHRIVSVSYYQQRKKLKLFFYCNLRDNSTNSLNWLTFILWPFHSRIQCIYHIRPLVLSYAPSHSLRSPSSEEGSTPLSCLLLNDPLSVIRAACISTGVGLLLHHRQLTKGDTSEENSLLPLPLQPSTARRCSARWGAGVEALWFP